MVMKKKATHRERLEPSGEEKKEDIIKGKMQNSVVNDLT